MAKSTVTKVIEVFGERLLTTRKPVMDDAWSCNSTAKLKKNEQDCLIYKKKVTPNHNAKQKKTYQNTNPEAEQDGADKVWFFWKVRRNLRQDSLQTASWAHICNHMELTKFV